MDVSEDTKVSPSKVEPGELLEEGWFFGNLLDRKSRTMSRCFSDPCPSSKLSQEMLAGKSYEDTYSSINKLVFPPDACGRARAPDVQLVSTPPQPRPPPALIRTPSMPSPIRSNPSRVQLQTSNTTTTTTTTSNNNRLQRTPSLPAMDTDIDHSDEDEESDYSMGNLIRQASLGQSRTLPPRQNMSKNLIPKQQYPRRKAEQEGSRRQHISKREKTKSGLANVETKKVMKGSDIESPIKEIKILPKLEEMRITEEESEEKRRAYIEERRRLERSTSASPVLTSDDMKAQLKFWARAVASNVR